MKTAGCVLILFAAGVTMRKIMREHNINAERCREAQAFLRFWENTAIYLSMPLSDVMEEYMKARGGKSLLFHMAGADATPEEYLIGLPDPVSRILGEFLCLVSLSPRETLSDTLRYAARRLEEQEKAEKTMRHTAQKVLLPVLAAFACLTVLLLC